MNYLETLTIEELHAKWEVAYYYFQSVGDDFSKQTLADIAGAMAKKVGA